jgi:hypothetical protein
MTGIGKKLVVLGLAAGLWAAVAPANAEVSVQSTLPFASGPDQILRITEDPDVFPLRFWEDAVSSGNPSRVALNPGGDANGDGRPSMLLSPVSGPIVAWARNSASGFDVVVSRFSGGAWTEPMVVAGTADDELDPWLALDPSNGTVHLVFWTDGPTPTVLHRQAPADLSSWSAPLQVSDGVDPSYRPASAFHAGTLRVTYEVHRFGPGQTPREIVLAERVGDTFYPQVLAVSNHGGELWPQVHTHAGKLWLDWIDSADEMAWIRLLPLGGWSPAQYEVFLNPVQLELFVRGKIRTSAIQPQN